MESSISSVLVCGVKEHEQKEGAGRGVVSESDPRGLEIREAEVPRKFVWGKEYLEKAQEEMEAPTVDLGGFLRGDPEATHRAAELVREACLAHGFFQVINHGVDPVLIKQAYHQMDAFFKLPLHTKLMARKPPGATWGYSSAHADRFSSNLPWKETLSFPFPHSNASHHALPTNYFSSTLGHDFQQTGEVFEKYCEAMKELGLKLMEVVGMSLGVDRRHYREYFEDGCSIMRCNYYPQCQDPTMALGTGPHCDPTSLTILHQDQVGGLEVFVDNKWKAVPPRPDSFVINVGDTFMALSNGRYKSCVHRAVVNSYNERRSLAFFVCPKEDKVVRPPLDMVRMDGTRHYPDFTWSDLLLFTQHFYRADDATLHHFTRWLLSSKPHVRIN